MKKYYIKQKISGAIIALIGVITPIMDNGDATFTLFALPLGIYLMVTKEKCIIDLEGNTDDNTQQK